MLARTTRRADRSRLEMLICQKIGRMRLFLPGRKRTGVPVVSVLRLGCLVVLGVTPALAGCVCDPPVERLSSHRPVSIKKQPEEKKVAVAAPIQQPAVAPQRSAPLQMPVKLIKVKSCDCPEDFDPQICGKREAYTSWSPYCASSKSH